MNPPPKIRWPGSFVGKVVGVEQLVTDKPWKTYPLQTNISQNENWINYENFPCKSNVRENIRDSSYTC